MEAVRAWLTRLDATSPDALEMCFVPALVPGISGAKLQDGIVVLDPQARVPPRPGDCSPVYLSMLRYLDASDNVAKSTCRKN